MTSGRLHSRCSRRCPNKCCGLGRVRFFACGLGHGRSPCCAKGFVMAGGSTHLHDHIQSIVVAASALQGPLANHLQSIHIAEDVVNAFQVLAGIDMQKISS